MLVKLSVPVTFKNSIPNELNIPNAIKKKVNSHWNEFIKDKTDYWNGEIIIVNDMDLNNNIVEIGTTKFSNLIYAKKNQDLTIRPLFASILLKTKDNKYLIIKNNHNKINLIGGMADLVDFKDDVFIPDYCIEREVLEEIGINLKNKNQVISYCLKYLKVPVNNENYFSVGLLYVGYLNFTSTDFANYINNNVFDGEIKECYFYNAEECLNLKLTDNDISYLKEFIELENENLK